MPKETINFCTTIPPEELGVVREFYDSLVEPRSFPSETSVFEEILLKSGYVLRRQLSSEEIAHFEEAVRSAMAARGIQNATIMLDFLKPQLGVNVAILVDPEVLEQIQRQLDEWRNENSEIDVAPPERLITET